MRYNLPELANEYMKLFEKAKKLYDTVNLTDFKYTKRFDEIIDRMKELEHQAKDLLPVEAAADPAPQPVKKQRGGKRDGAGRKGKGYIRRKPTISMDPVYWEMFDTMAGHFKMDQAALIRAMMQTFIDHYNEQGMTITGFYDPKFSEFDYVLCPVCSGYGEIDPKGAAAPILCPGCSGEKLLKQVKLKMEG
ncbi:hypothetical protein P9314_05170 [Paenibacillus validus]|uniref:hypothetical protein n=1 Tax=Paenibacillus validus TaxID=44253 RepID=UPI000FD95B98|nr:hypothetical protein [Paenibacillus validus]MED4600100.1 hypothetical protein [Paenibacillus validus]MED4605548.1 hypothetical protein [Paenibacillus validus]